MPLIEEITENIVKPVVNKSERKSSVIISFFCIGIILFILFTQCKVSKIQLQMKDASLILIFFALLAYINGYEMLFVVLLGAFVLIYFTPQKYFDKYLSPILGKKETKKSKIIIEDNEKTNTTDNEITLDTEIELDDNIDDFEQLDGEDNIVEEIRKKSD